jgi:iron complex transport system permease protein
MRFLQVLKPEHLYFNKLRASGASPGLFFLPSNAAVSIPDKSAYFSALLAEQMKPHRSPLQILLILGSLLTGLFVLDVSLGSVKIPIAEVFSVLMGNHADSTWADIVWQFRLPKALTCILAGASLACGGLMMQTLFRNPLAGPDVLGLTSGASLFVATLILAGTSGAHHMSIFTENAWSVVLAASLGSSLVFLMIIVVAQKLKDNVSLLIVGLMIGAVTSSIVSVLQYVSRAEDLQVFMIWTLGSVGGTGWDEIKVLAVVLLIGTGISLWSVKSLNAMLLGENYAQSIGVNIKKSRLWIVLSTSILAGAVTAFCGPIAFVGLAVPHLIRLFTGTSNHKMLLPAVMAGGASLILFCDLITQLPGSTQMLPLNAITSLIGAPVVIWMIMRRKKNLA